VPEDSKIAWAALAVDGRERARSRPSGRELKVDAAALAVFLGLAVLLLVLGGSVGTLSWLDVVVIGGAYAAASKIELDVGSGYTVPTQFVLVVALLVLPPAVVPLLVLCALVAAEAPAVLRGQIHPLRLLIAGGDAIHALAPAAVLIAADPGRADLSHWPVYVAALAAQLALDLLTTLVRERLRVGVAPFAHLRELGFLYALDVTLAPLGLCAALADQQADLGYVLILPTLLFAHMLATERRGRIEGEVALAEVSAAAQTDALTGALNRRGWDEYLDRALESGDVALTVAMLDVDDLKTVNDTEGHAAGDVLLAGAAAGWRGVLRADDVLGRLGGDEFIVGFPGKSEGDVAAIGNRLRQSLPDGHTCSVGFASARPGDTAQTLTERADARLYEDKRRSHRFTSATRV
jgi:diguanylate cyclase (GGDEF)-like protein